MEHLDRQELARLLALRRALARLDPAGRPEVELLRGQPPAVGARVGVLAGSFNPPTNAHVALARSATHHGGLDTLWFALSVRTVDKERVLGLSLEDRLLLLRALVEGEPAEPWGVALFNRGLYVEQAEAVRAQFPGADLWFVVGWDKIVQIFDRRYYADGEASLQRLFALARFLVAPRGAGDVAALRTLLARPENAPYAERVVPLPLDPAYRDLSATAVREALAAGRSARGRLPEPVDAFLARSGAFDAGAPGRYARRQATLDMFACGEPGA